MPLTGDLFNDNFGAFMSIYLTFDLIAVLTVASICASIFVAHGCESTFRSSKVRYRYQ